MQREPEEMKEEKTLSEEEEEEMMELNESIKMLNIINDLLEARGEVKVHAQDWAMLCPHQEQLLFDVFFCVRRCICLACHSSIESFGALSAGP